MRLLLIYLIPLFITSIVCPPKHTRDSPDGDPNKRRNVSGESDTGTGTGTSNPDATTSTGMPSSQGEWQTNPSGLHGLAEIFGSHPFLNQQEEQNLPSFGSFQPYQSDIWDYHDQPIFSPQFTPQDYWDYQTPQPTNPSSIGNEDLQSVTESDQIGTGSNNPDATTSTGMPSYQGEGQSNPGLQGWEDILGDQSFFNQHEQQHFPSLNSTHQHFGYQGDMQEYYQHPIFSPQFTPQNYWDYQPAQSTSLLGDADLNTWLEDIDKEESIPKQADQADPKDKKPKKLGTQKERAEERVKELGYTPSQIRIDKPTFKQILGRCQLCKDYNGSDFGFRIKDDKAIDEHIQSKNHLEALKYHNINPKEKETSSKTQTKERKQPIISEPSTEKSKVTKKERISRISQKINDLGYSNKIRIIKSHRTADVCLCNLCGKQFIVHDEHGIDKHIIAEHQSAQAGQTYAQESHVYESGNQPYESGSQTYAQASQTYSKGSKSYAKANQRYMQGSYQETVTPEEQHYINQAIQASLNDIQNQPQRAFQILGFDSTEQNQQSTQNNDPKGKGKAKRKD